MGEGISTQGDRHPFQPGEIAEADLAGLIGQREHHRRRRAMQGFPVLHPTLQGTFERNPVLIWVLLLQVLQQRQRQCHAWSHAGIAAGEDGSAQILFQAKSLKRQPLLRIPVPYGQVPAQPQRDQIRDAPSTSQWSRHGNCQQRADVYETARQAKPTRWSRSTRCWRQPDEVWINKSTEEPAPIMALPLIQAA